MDSIDDLDFLRIGKFVFNDNRISPINNYGEFIFNVIAINLKEDPNSFIMRKISSNSKMFEVGGYKYGLNTKGSEIFISDLTDYLSDISNFIDLLALQHEIKNPLTVIDGASQILRNREVNEFVSQSAEIIQKESGRIKNILDGLSILHRDLTIEKIFLRKFIDELTSSISSIHDGVEFTVDVDPEIIHIYGDYEHLYRSFFNIIKNSCDAMPNTRIRISVSIDTSLKIRYKGSNRYSYMLRFIINDTSGGIKDCNIHKIFNPFFSTKSKGTGLGLFIAKTIIEKHGGRIYFNSNFGVGTTFYILLPLNQGDDVSYD